MVATLKKKYKQIKFTNLPHCMKNKFKKMKRRKNSIFASFMEKKFKLMEKMKNWSTSGLVNLAPWLGLIFYAQKCGHSMGNGFILR